MNDKEHYSNQWNITLSANNIQDALKQLIYLTEFAFLNVEKKIEIQDSDVSMICIKTK